MEAAAPDSQVQTAGRKLAKPQPWHDVGCSGTLLWGRCQGSGKTPYQVSIDVAGPSYKCSCPSRKFPCKHAYALLLLWAEGHVEAAGMADFAAEWAADSSARAERKAKPDKDLTPEELADRAAQAEKRLAERENRVDDGVVELDRFLTDQLEQGLAAQTAGRRRAFDDMAARMVDQQAPGLAGWLRELADVPDVGADWPGRLTDELGLMRLLIRGWQHRAGLSDELRETVRARIGFTTRAEDVLQTAGVSDDWAVIGMSDSENDQVSTRRVWLWGAKSNRPALVLFFATGGAALQSNLYPGTVISATLHFYPGSYPMRAVVGERATADEPLNPGLLATDTSDAARQRWLQALSADPWLDRIPAIVSGRLLHDGTQLWFGEEQSSLPVLGNKLDRYQLLHLTTGATCVVAGELSAAGLRPMTVVEPTPTVLTGDNAA